MVRQDESLISLHAHAHTHTLFPNTSGVKLCLCSRLCESVAACPDGGVANFSERWEELPDRDESAKLALANNQS